jgi:hypothetical protein
MPARTEAQKQKSPVRRRRGLGWLQRADQRMPTQGGPPKRVAVVVLMIAKLRMGVLLVDAICNVKKSSARRNHVRMPATA